jgi:DNA polymerase III delta prime subunit
MDKRKLEYRQLMEMDDGFAGKTVLCNVFYLRGSPKNKEVIEDRIVKLPSTDPRFSGELKYKAYHLNQVTIDMMIEKNLPFLLPFIIQSELQNISDDESPIKQIEDIRQQIHENEEALTKMIDGLSEEKIESLRTIVEYMWQKSYSKEVFNKSTLLKLMKEQLNLRQSDVAMVITMERARRIAVANQMVQEGEITQKQMEKFLKRMEEYKNDSSNKST